MQDEIDRLQADLDEIHRREQGLLGEVARLGALLRLRQEEERRATLQHEAVSAEVESRTEELARIERSQAERARYLAYRLRETYKAGSVAALRRVIAAESADSLLQGARYATYLGERDARMLRAFRESAESVRSERARLSAQRAELDRARNEASLARARAAASREERSRLLESIRVDRGRHEQAIGELTRASRELGDLVARLGAGGAGPRLDVTKFRGLLEWPVAGDVAEGFGAIVHPRFKTVLPHPGLDLRAEAGTPFRSVFGGRVLYSGWLHGYGLTVLVDHGGDVLTVYAHASALSVDVGQDVLAGDVLGLVGDSGSLRGAYLYFEIREGGRPVDPSEWLSAR